MLAPQIAIAEPADRKIEVLGVGTISCGMWTSHHQSPGSWTALMEDSWLNGYITGYNQFGIPTKFDDFSLAIDAQGLRSWVNNYCQANPLDQVAIAATALVRELRSRSINK